MSVYLGCAGRNRCLEKKRSKDVRPQMVVKHGNGNLSLPAKQKSNFTPELHFIQDIMHWTHFQPSKRAPFLCQHYVSYVGWNPLNFAKISGPRPLKGRQMVLQGVNKPSLIGLISTPWKILGWVTTITVAWPFFPPIMNKNVPVKMGLNLPHFFSGVQIHKDPLKLEAYVNFFLAPSKPRSFPTKPRWHKSSGWCSTFTLLICSSFCHLLISPCKSSQPKY